MKIFESAELHPPLRNEHRAEVYLWCEKNIIDVTNCYESSTYDEQGDFKIVVSGEKNEPFVTAFLLKYPNTICHATYRHELETAAESLALFEGL
jgi:hypothetical protein